LSKGPKGENIFVSADKVSDYPESELAKIPVHIKYVTDYGSADSYLDYNGIQAFLDWRKSYKDAEFITAEGTIKAGTLVSGDKDSFKFRTKSEVGKMSKRYHNVVNPDDVVARHGADTFRLYEMFLGPIGQSKPWDTKGIEGVSKFVRRLWGLFFNSQEVFDLSSEEPTKEEYKILHQAIKKVGADIEKFSFNTAISAMMICVNELKKLKTNKKKILEPLLIVFSSFAPFASEELWSMMGNDESIHTASFPKFDEKHLGQDSFDYPICINGKKRAIMSFPADATNEDMEQQALALDEIQKWKEDKNVVKVIVVTKRMINIVVK